ncbi:MarR family winged helix-turn-helix transcriptional regulator [Agrococcus jejuensis]|uniref:MarR family winged helix-turn-helix transcriptional regulator n=1 Tax=Agrococcus jejuensis TaxID=399736 RepID=UPI001E51F5D9|nr:MarR family transcriptional regulator [Agrococcus jejuensis]
MPDAAPDMRDWPTGRLLAMAARLVEHEWHDTLQGAGITHAGLVVLDLLGDGPLAQAELARRARVEVQTISRTVDRLEREGHVERTLDPADRRSRLVARTAAGEAAWAQARSLEARAIPAVDDADALRAQLLQIVQALSARRWS